jgi:hypothetical protein
MRNHCFFQLQEASDQQNLEKLRDIYSRTIRSSPVKDMLSRSTAKQVFTQVLALAADLVAVEESGR